MGVSGFGFGGVAIALVFGVSTDFGAPSSLLFEKNFCSRWSRGIPRLDVDPISGILCSSCVIFYGV